MIFIPFCKTHKPPLFIYLITQKAAVIHTQSAESNLLNQLFSSMIQTLFLYIFCYNGVFNKVLLLLWNRQIHNAAIGI